jgi:hypothetical protein
LGRNALTRGATAATAVATACGLALGLAPLGAAPALAADLPPEAVIQPYGTERRFADTIGVGGATGYVHKAEDATSPVWRSYDGKVVHPLPDTAPVYARATRGADGREVVTYAQQGRYGTQRVLDTVTGEVTERALPEGETFLGAVGTPDGLLTASVFRRAGGTGFGVHLLAPSGDGWSAREVTGLPAGSTGFLLRAADGRGGVLSWSTPSGPGLGYVDFASGAVLWTTSLANAARLAFDERHVAWFAGGAVHLRSRTEPGAPERTVALPAPAQGTPDYRIALVGDAVLAVRTAAKPDDGVADPLYAVGLADGAEVRTVLPEAASLIQSGDGGALLFGGGAGGADWAVQRMAPGAAAPAALLPVGTTKPVRYGLSLDRGRLGIAEGMTSRTGGIMKGSLHQYEGGTGPAPVAGDRTERYALGATASGLFAAEGGEVTYLTGQGDDVIAHQYHRDVLEGHRGGRIVDADRRWAVYDSGTQDKQLVLDTVGGGTLLERPEVAAAVYDTTLWSATATAGRFTSYDLAEAEETGSVTTDVPCVPTEIQAVHRWLYWSCGADGPAGVYDRTAKKSVRVDGGDVLLGDGFTVRHAAGELRLTDVTSGTARTRTVASLPHRGAGGHDRRVTWTVDRYRGHIAYTDAAGATHIAPTGATGSALETLRPAADDPSVWPRRSDPWRTRWELTGPAASWTAEFRHRATGALVATTKGTGDRTAVTAAWDGVDAQGAPALSGAYTWTVRITPADGRGADLVRSGTVALYHGRAPRHDFGLDGTPDLLAINKYAGMELVKGRPDGTLSDKPAETSPLPWDDVDAAVAIGDPLGDGCNDLLLRHSSGVLFRAEGSFDGACRLPDRQVGTVRVSLGTGWDVHNLITSPGDLTGDGLDDVIGRAAATGDIWLYAGRADGRLQPGVRISSNWSAYKKVVGAGDLNGDGHGDLLLQDASNELWRVEGRGDGTVRSRVLVFSDWGANRDTVLGIGDLSGDGKADLLSRDTSGNLWRNDGNGAGSFGGSRLAGSGWTSYRTLF